MSRVFLERCHHGLCYHIAERPLPNINLDQHIFPTVSFVVIHLADYVKGTYEKKLPTKLKQKAIVDNFCRGRLYEWLEGHLFLDFLGRHWKQRRAD